MDGTIRLKFPCSELRRHNPLHFWTGHSSPPPQTRLHALGAELVRDPMAHDGLSLWSGWLFRQNNRLEQGRDNEVKAHDDFKSNSIRYCSKYQTAKIQPLYIRRLCRVITISYTTADICRTHVLTTITRQLLANVDQTRHCISWSDERKVAIGGK